MPVHNPVVMVENEWVQHPLRRQLADALDLDIELVTTFDEMTATLDQLAADGAPEPIVVLDAGIPGVCRLDAVTSTLDHEPRSRIVLWTADRNLSTHCGALLDGARASLPKVSPLSTLCAAVEWVASGRIWIEPEQAQWLADFCLCMRTHRAETRETIWKYSELAGLDPTTTESLEAHLRELAQGQPLDPQQRWIHDVIDLVGRHFLPPHLRRVRRALGISFTRKGAAAALDISARSLDGYCGRLAGRLMPERYIRNDSDNPERGHALLRLMIETHNVCELAFADHDLT
jgi:DNA-binding NarL/FixJ family response regulator